MANETINDLYSIRFSDMIHVRAQQHTARMRPYVEIMSDVKGADSVAYDGLGRVEAKKQTDRYAESLPTSIEHNRRQISGEAWEITLFVDQNDLESTLFNPQSKYADACIMAMERRFDLITVGAMFADVKTGRDFTTTVTATADGVLTVDATGGLTLAKLLEGEQNFMDNEVGNDGDMAFAYGVSGSENKTLLQISQLTDNRFTNRMQLDSGKIRQAMNYNLIPFGANEPQPVLSVASNIRTSFLLAKGGICVAMWRDWQVTVKDRPDLINVTQVQVTGRMGAVRTEGKLLQKFTTTP